MKSKNILRVRSENAKHLKLTVNRRPLKNFKNISFPDFG